MISSTIEHTQIGDRPYWYHLECSNDFQQAKKRAHNYALDHGGYVCVKDESGHVVFGTDPAAALSQTELTNLFRVRRAG
jgi:hypothetical protein